MAVTNSTIIEAEQVNEPLMRDYWHAFKRRAKLLIISTQCLVGIVIAGLLILSGAADATSVVFWIAMTLMVALIIGANFLLLHLIAEPFSDLIRAVIHISDEPTSQTPPNPNLDRYQKNGFKKVLQTVYELSVDTTAPAQPVETPDTILRHGLDHTKTGIVILGPDRSIIYSNKKAPVYIDQTGKRTFGVLFPQNDTLYDWLDTCEKKSVHAEEIWTRIPDRPAGEKGRRLFDITASYQKNDSAETIVTFFDRSDSYSPEEDDLDFISFAAHELRGPITVIRGYLDVLDSELEPVLENDQAELLKRLIVSSNRLSSYVNNILNASRYDRRHFKIHLTEETLPDIYESIKDDMQLRAVSQSRLLTVDFPDNLPTIAADRNSIGEVLSNLIDNAIKYSNEGGLVTVTAKPIGSSIEVSVVDRGIGMPANVIPHLFHKFYRSHRSRETVAGTGIGLYISKAIVESHGGVITAQSTERGGSTFTFTLPVYDTVADKLKASNNSNEQLIGHGSGWIRNHSMYRG